MVSEVPLGLQSPLGLPHVFPWYLVESMMPCSAAGLFTGNSLLFVANMHLLVRLLDTLIDFSYWQQNGALLKSFVYIV